MLLIPHDPAQPLKLSLGLVQPDRIVARRAMACTKCGRIGAEVQPDWSPHTSRLIIAGRPKG
jgi:hypothetical protein